MKVAWRFFIIAVDVYALIWLGTTREFAGDGFLAGLLFALFIYSLFAWDIPRAVKELR